MRTKMLEPLLQNYRMLPTPTLHLYINKGLFATYFNLVYFVQLSRKNSQNKVKLKTQFENT